MGLFSKKEKKQDRAEEQGTVVTVTFEDNSSILAMNPVKVGKTITHRDGSKYALMMYDVSNYAPDGGTIYVISPNKVLVEKPLNPDGTVTDLTKQEMYDYTVAYVNQLVAGYHDQNKICRYIGRQDPETGKMIISPKTKADIEQTVEPEILEAIRVRNEQKRIEREAREAAEHAKFIEDAKEQNKLYQERVRQTREERIRSEKFEYVRSTTSGNHRLDSYDAVDLQSGDVLRIRNLCKHGKDKDNVYLYSVDLATTPNEHDVEFLDTSGKVAAFTTKVKIEDLLTKVPGGKRKALELFTMANAQAEYGNGAKFIGNLDEYGNMYGTDIRQCSDAIQSEYERINQQVLEKQEMRRQRFAEANNRAGVTPLNNREDRDIG